MIIKCCLSLAAKSSADYDEIRYDEIRYDEKKGTGLNKPERGFNPNIMRELLQ